ncbi:MAG: sugar phosphate isomerase/epimerase [Spirochaetales bacterium]|nr:sugar phosphate isomerase/epimerase [Spirochaetales bacterium]
MKHIAGVSTNTYHGFSLEQALDGISAAGFSYVELTEVKGWTEHVSASMTDAELAELKEMLEKRGLKAFALSGHCDLMDDDRLKDFTRNIELAGRLGCDFIVSSAGEAHFGKDKGTMDELLIENLRRIVPECKKHRVKLVIEVHGEYGTGAQLKTVIDAVDSQWVKINYDTANVVFYGKKLPDEDIKTCSQAVGYVHLKDKAGAMDEWNFPAPGKGDLKLIETIEYLEGSGYGGPLSVEIEFTEAFTMNPKKPEDIDVVNIAVKDAFAFLNGAGLV